MRRAFPERAIVVGAGPNGLAAAIVCARSGLRVSVYEAEGAVGGGSRSAPLTRPGFLHDHCASVFPFGTASPFFRSLPLERYGVEWRHPAIALAHPLDGGGAAVLHRSLEATAAALGPDGSRYDGLMRPLVQRWEALAADVLAPPRWPAHPGLLARFGLRAVLPATLVASRFASTGARALFAGLAAHSGLPLDAPLTAAFALLLAAFGHAAGWPVARGGAQTIADALASCLREHGGTILCDRRIDDLSQLPPADLVLCDVAPEQLAQMAAARLPGRFRRRLQRFSRRCAAFKVDWALDRPIPWRAEACSLAGTVHVGGTLEEIAASEAALRGGRAPDRPFVLVTQPSVCDPSRAPDGQHVAWGYCHVPPGSSADMTGAIEGQIERFAPGFRRTILARHVLAPADFERGNASLIGGDISGGALALDQLLTRPTWRHYGTPVNGLYLCSASTPPGAGVHGMCGYWAATTALGRSAG